MHEAGLAAAIATGLEEGRRAGFHGSPRVLVRGGHDVAADFDASLLFHLSLVAPDLGPGLEIVHLPVDRLCAGCGRSFSAADLDAVCPACGGAAWPSATTEEVELDWPSG